MEKILLNVILLAMLLLLSALFSGSETAMFSLSGVRVQRLVKERAAGSATLHRLLDKPRRLIITILVGNTLVNTASATVAASLAISIMGNRGIGVAIGVMTFLLLVLGEITPKTYAFNHAEGFSLRMARPIAAFSALIRPITWVLEGLTDLILKPVDGERHHISREEFDTLIRESESQGILAESEKKMMQSVFSMSTTPVKEIMVPLKEIIAVGVDSGVQEIISVAAKDMTSRLPVYTETLDDSSHFIHIKDILEYKWGKEDFDIRRVMHPIIAVNENKTANELMKSFQAKRTHLALVKDGHGQVTGLVTLEDLLEELVGEIEDEYDLEKGGGEAAAQPTADGAERTAGGGECL
ncbi:MAG: hemolysin [Thermoplasmata archaeon HGW-Thermoplasmata-1]|nr:MAG: hemolysin [Thermoplasmata archaeon HGW-Thermoplasmata-1]